jgi:hypothetical protein
MTKISLEQIKHNDPEFYAAAQGLFFDYDEEILKECYADPKKRAAAIKIFEEEFTEEGEITEIEPESRDLFASLFYADVKRIASGKPLYCPFIMNKKFKLIDSTPEQLEATAGQIEYCDPFFRIPPRVMLSQPPQRILAFGNTWGSLDELNRLIDKVEPTQDDLLIFLGGYLPFDKESGDVLEYLMELERKFPRTVFLRGIQEHVLLNLFLLEGLRQKAYRGCSETHLEYPQNLTEEEHRICNAIFEAYRLESVDVERHFILSPGGCMKIFYGEGFSTIPVHCLEFLQRMPVLHNLAVNVGGKEREFYFSSSSSLYHVECNRMAAPENFLNGLPYNQVRGSWDEEGCPKVELDMPTGSIIGADFSAETIEWIYKFSEVSKTTGFPRFVYSHGCKIREGDHYRPGEENRLDVPVGSWLNMWVENRPVACCDVLSGRQWVSSEPEYEKKEKSGAGDNQYVRSIRLAGSSS